MLFGEELKAVRINVDRYGGMYIPLSVTDTRSHQILVTFSEKKPRSGWFRGMLGEVRDVVVHMRALAYNRSFS